MGCSSVDTYDKDSKYQSFAPDGISFEVADSAWDVDNKGNHRAIVNVKEKRHEAVIVHLPWRRPDLRPETKKIVVIDEHTGKEIKDITILNFSSEEGTIAFRPDVIPGKYSIYYLPYKFRTKWGDARYGKPWNDYLPPIYETNQDWEKKVRINQDNIPKVSVECFQSRTHFDFFTSMGLIATRKEKEDLILQNRDDFLLFPEDRSFPIKLTTIPVRWARSKISDSFIGNASLNEYYTWQIGVWAVKKDLHNISVSFGDLIHESKKARISHKNITCFNTEGINWDGLPIKFDLDIDQEKVQALWFGVQIPESTKPGLYKGQLKISAENSIEKTIGLKINVNKNLLADKGDAELWRHSRLRWLNSCIGIDSLPVQPYGVMELDGQLITASNKFVLIDKNGAIESVKINDRDVFSSPVEFLIETSSGMIPLKAESFSISKDADGLISWSSSGQLEQGIKFDWHAYMEYDGYIRNNIRLFSEHEAPVQNIKLISHFHPESSEYFMGAGFKGGHCPENHLWKWEGPYDSFWLGGDKSGLHVELRGGTYHGPLLNDYKPAPPKAWSNNGKGQILLSNKNGQATVEVSTGRTIISSTSLDFEFAFLITPVKPIDLNTHFSQRYYHSSEQGFDKAAKEGANIINIHHSRNLNPVINYPFIVRDSLISYVQEQHKHNRKVKLYYTIRELSNYAEEIFALKSLNHEIFISGVGYGVPWHCEHLVDDYKPAWYTELPGQNSDAALVLNGFSRWINYYLEGLRWMLENYKIDGLYMDDVSFDRTVMKRIRKILEKYRPGSLIDLHSNTGYSIGPANQYTDFFPYIDRLWFGESFRYNEMLPDEWFVTFSGIPFGLMSEMLQDGGNRFLGMVYGVTGRHSYSQFSPAPVWKLWKDFDIQNADMLGYWDKDCPVKTNHPNVKATAFIKPNEILISIGNFDNEDRNVLLSFDWERLNINHHNASFIIPEIENFQKGEAQSIDNPIVLRAKEGVIIQIIKKEVD